MIYGNNVKYAPGMSVRFQGQGKLPPLNQELDNLLFGRSGNYVYEIWEGLPEVEFQASPSTGGAWGKLHQSPDSYIWVPPTTALAIEKAPQGIFYAFGQRTSTHLNIRTVELAAENIRYIKLAINHARNLNESFLWNTRDAKSKLRRLMIYYGSLLNVEIAETFDVPIELIRQMRPRRRSSINLPAYPIQ